MTPISKRKRARFIYAKSKNIAKRLHLYTKSETLCKKQDNLRYVFIHKNTDTLCYMIFHEKFVMGIYIYTKSMALCVRGRFYIKNLETSKKQDNLRYVFICKNPDTLRHKIFMGYLKLAEGGGHFYSHKNNALCVKLLYDKNNALSGMVLYKKVRNFVLHFHLQKNALCVTFLYLKLIV